MAKIIAVEDEASLLGGIVRVLTSAGHEVRPLTNGEQALQVAAQDAFDLALVDYQLPGANGLQVLESLSYSQPECVRILMSGMLDVPVTVEAVNRAAVMRVLEKPFGLQTLLSTVHDALETHCRRAELYQSAAAEQRRAERRMLDDCLAGDALQLALQPICAVRTRRIVAYEALLRSSHPVLDSPDAVLKAAERHQRIAEVGALVASRAARRLTSLPPEVGLFVNLHPLELANAAKLGARLAPLQPMAQRVVFEITERFPTFNVDEWRRSIEGLSQLGFCIAVDDLGAGYNSLSVLAALEPQFIKVDMSIIRDVDKQPQKRRILELLCRFAQASDAQLIAEGVETEAEADAVVSCGADLMQGYLFGRPSLAPPSL